MTTLQASTLRPGLLVSFKTTVSGNCTYATTELESQHVTATGEARARWETEKTITDPEEHERALKARSLARSAIQTVCAKSAFGLLCPEANADRLAAAVAKARAIADAFNDTASVTRVSVNVLVGRVSADDVEAVRAINSEVRDLMTDMARGLANLDVEVVREAARKAKSVGQMLEPNAQERVKKAIEVAREAARSIVKAGEVGAVAVDEVSIQRITEARLSFLDLDDAVEVQAPEAAVPVVDFEPENNPYSAERVNAMFASPVIGVED